MRTLVALDSSEKRWVLDRVPLGCMVQVDASGGLCSMGRIGKWPLCARHFRMLEREAIEMHYYERRSPGLKSSP